MTAVRKKPAIKNEVKILTIPKTSASRKLADKESAVDLVVSKGDLAVVPQLVASRPASRVDAKPLDLDVIIEDVAHAIATTQDHYKCIMFTDLESSTEYKRSMGHTKGYMRNRLFCDICERAVERYNGHVVKRLGDGVMVVFERAIDAVMASLMIKSSIANGRKKLKKIVGAMDYRIGITCGYVKEIPGDTKDYIGHAMDKGARIQSSARRNQILIDEIVYGLIHTKIRDYSGDIVIGSPKNMTLKGVGTSTLYEVSPKQMGLESSLGKRMKSMLS
ncbi:Adenylate and Guanylate cyclase catalytic domain-containing protein [Mariprofundus ferrinatatus]|uniref:Adenylate and Guanylate cyclase catalytic domain-containing protein n=1 Tax=Mariprofundus ferrinatatus TaxID=1921087 RepID=A0A2K8L5R2_9PROT|nr:adenylate/guanylate cyclase domain-containing protein [Mariprofundus ferrinatatus]ATX82573.1 Adenylate and Guanylate cyclase catalytic domain-containing protein [Mariprofundus ferrinatatus]